jgi:hypothetical protein
MAETPSDSTESSQAAERATQSAKSFTEAITQIRQRADYAAKGLAAIGTAAISAIGYAKLADVFPFGGPDWATWLLGIGVALMILAVVFLVRRFYGASESIVTNSDVDRTVALNSLSAEEEKVLRNVYRDTAELNGLETLRAYEARGQRLERIADRFASSGAKLLHDQAQLIFTEIGAAQARAGAFVLRERSTSALFAKTTCVLLALFVAGWYFVALSADAMQSRRSDEITVAKSCAEARKEEKIVESKLPEICGTAPEADEEEATAAETSDQAVKSLAESLATCKKAAAKSHASPKDCLPIERALQAAIEQ